MVSYLALALLRSSSDVEGRVTLANGKPAGHAIVIFEGREKSSPMPKAVVDQRDRTFLPHISVVTVGTRVDFPNNDVVYHNVFTEFHSSKFDLGMYPKGTSKSQVFTRTGLAVIMCSVHPEMSAYVMVVDTPYYAIADKAGRYEIHGVPSGQYRVEIWQESGGKASMTVDLPGQAHADFVLKR